MNRYRFVFCLLLPSPAPALSAQPEPPAEERGQERLYQLLFPPDPGDNLRALRLVARYLELNDKQRQAIHRAFEVHREAAAPLHAQIREYSRELR